MKKNNEMDLKRRNSFLKNIRKSKQQHAIGGVKNANLEGDTAARGAGVDN